MIHSGRPLSDLSLLLEEKYAQPVTYEDPVWLWRGDLSVQGSDERDPLALWLKNRKFVLPLQVNTSETFKINMGVLQGIIEAYNRQNADGTQFKIITSYLGFHIVPWQMYNENGKMGPASTLFDVTIQVDAERRMASEHIKEICDAISAASGTSLRMGNNKWLDEFYAAGGVRPPRFAAKLLDEEQRAPFTFLWGSGPTTGREALLALLSSSSTTFSWRLLCQPSAKPENRFCVLNVDPLQVRVLDADGKPVVDEEGHVRKRSLSFDRLGKLPTRKSPPITIR